METTAEKFQQTVFETLDRTVPVLGVIRNKETPILNAVRARDDIILLTVNKNNREYILEKKLVYYYQKLIEIKMIFRLIHSLLHM